MVDIVQTRKEAIEFAQKAVEADEANSLEDAAKFYLKAAERLNTLKKLDENTYNKETYAKRALQYCSRVQEIKDSLEGKKEKKVATTADGSLLYNIELKTTKTEKMRRKMKRLPN